VDFKEVPFEVPYTAPKRQGKEQRRPLLAYVEPPTKVLKKKENRKSNGTDTESIRRPTASKSHRFTTKLNGDFR
jgi:hypothetical protein